MLRALLVATYVMLSAVTVAAETVLYPVQEKNLVGYIDESGKVVVPLVYQATLPFSEGLAAVRKDNLWGFVDEHGVIVIAPAFEDARQFSAGLAPIKWTIKPVYIQ